jgi:hypothetical protein
MTKAEERHAAWRLEFKSLGEENVRMMDSGSQVVPDDKIRFSRVWLKEQEDSRRDTREDKTLRLAKWANIIAIIAAILAAIAAREDIKWLIHVLSKFIP